MNNVELYWNEDHTAYAVLVSGGFGAGWSTWEGKELAYDKRVVEFWLEHEHDKEWMRTVTQSKYGATKQSEANKEAEAFFHSIWDGDCPYLGGFSSIHLEWVPAGKMWKINEYDGSESLCFQKDYDWNCFN